MTKHALAPTALAPLQTTGGDPTALAPLQTTGGDPTALAPLQTTGGDPTVVLVALGTLFLATALSLYLAVRLYRGYRQGGSPAMAVLGLGLVLLTTVPMLLRITLATVPDVPGTSRVLAVTASQLLGLLVILGVVYGGR